MNIISENMVGHYFQKKEEQEQLSDQSSAVKSSTSTMVGSGSCPFSHKNDLYQCPSTTTPATDLSLGTNRAGNVEEGAEPIEKEHMFDKVVTPSDVGKLNRLVIPKQHAEKYFPLNSASNEKGLLLNFEDRNGKPWRFRYSYWNSSQSYVMTKGWSRFVKEKKLDAGDIVSFQRGVGKEGRNRLFIDWRRRPSVSAQLEFQNQFNVRWGNHLLYSLPHLQHPIQPQAPPFNYPFIPYTAPFQFYSRNAAPYCVKPNYDVSPMVIDSVPVVQGKPAGKRLRLFGVNMDCQVAPSHDAELGKAPPSQSQSGSPSLQLRLPSGGGIPMSTVQSHELSKKGKISLSFDLDL